VSGGFGRVSLSTWPFWIKCEVDMVEFTSGQDIPDKMRCEFGRIHFRTEPSQ
jgi:hypothetical protein